MKVTEKQVTHFYQKWFRRLLLSELWTVVIRIHHNIEDEPDEDHRGDEAYVEITDGYDHAQLTINAFRIPDGGLELAIAHEVVHLALRELEQLASAGSGKKMAAIVEAATERATERISRALVKR